MRRFQKGTFNSLNITLAVIVLIAAAYISYSASANSPTSAAAPQLNEKSLSDELFPGSDSVALNKDEAQIQSVIKRQNIDLSFANRVLAFSANRSAFSNASPAQKEAWLNALLSEANALSPLAVPQRSALIGQVNSLKSSLVWLNHVVQNAHLSGSARRLVAQPNAETFIQVGPEVALFKVADDQRVSEQLLSELMAAIIEAVQSSGVSGIAATNDQADLTTLSGNVSAAQSISQAVAADVYSTQYAQAAVKENLATAGLDIQAGLNAAETVINDLGPD